LEGALPATIATSVLFEALSAWDRGIPADAAELLAFTRGPLSEILTRRVGARAEAIVGAIVLSIDELEGGELEIEVTIASAEGDARADLADTALADTAQMRAVAHPVSVLVVSAGADFADRVDAALGPERVQTRTVSTIEAMRHASFSAIPVFVVVDATSLGSIPARDLAKALLGLPDATLGVVWGTDTSAGRDLNARLDGGKVVLLSRSEGIEPLLDLVLSRFTRTNRLPAGV
jgi:hypothetical protein